MSLKDPHKFLWKVHNIKTFFTFKFSFMTINDWKLFMSLKFWYAGSNKRFIQSIRRCWKNVFSSKNSILNKVKYFRLLIKFRFLSKSSRILMRRKFKHSPITNHQIWISRTTILNDKTWHRRGSEESKNIMNEINKCFHSKMLKIENLFRPNQQNSDFLEPMTWTLK
jgi:hypothetical protein